MPQKHYHQHGTFHVTTATLNRSPSCIEKGVPERLIHYLCDTRNMQGAKLFAFSIMPDHVHLLMSPGEKGLSSFLHAFKKNSSRNIENLFWQKGYHDELIRSDEQRSSALGYIQGNAMKHKLVKEWIDWPWSSLHYEKILDPMGLWFE